MEAQPAALQERTLTRALMTKQRFPVRDETLPHQIVLLHRGVSCNCRWRPGHGHVTFAPLTTTEAAFVAYLNPDNHISWGGDDVA